MPVLNGWIARLAPHNTASPSAKHPKLLDYVKEYHDPERLNRSTLEKIPATVECDVAVEDFKDKPMAACFGLEDDFEWPEGKDMLYVCIIVDGVLRGFDLLYKEGHNVNVFLFAGTGMQEGHLVQGFFRLERIEMGGKLFISLLLWSCARLTLYHSRRRERRHLERGGRKCCARGLCRKAPQLLSFRRGSERHAQVLPV